MGSLQHIEVTRLVDTNWFGGGTLDSFSALIWGSHPEDTQTSGMDSDHELLIIGSCIALVVILISLQPGESLVRLLGRLYKSHNGEYF
jgi:hypothetical protein